MTNVHDVCIFPMMSKGVSSIQAVGYFAMILQGEKSHEAVVSVWNKLNNVVAISRVFAGHFQVVCAILKKNSDSNYLSDKKCMSFKKTVSGRH